MWKPDDEIEAGLLSGDPSTLSDALACLAERVSLVDEYPRPPLDASVLAPFGTSPPESALLALFRILTEHREFDPPLSDTEITERVVRLAMDYDNERLAYEVALELNSGDEPATAVQRALATIARPELTAAQAENSARLISYLLDGAPAVRDATVGGMTHFPRSACHLAVINELRPALRPAELARVDVPA